MEYWSYPEWKKAQIEAAQTRTEYNLSRTPNSAKDKFNQNTYESGVNYLKPVNADTSLFTFIDKKVQFIVRQYSEANINIDNLGFENL